jgi:hypothetical protein
MAIEVRHLAPGVFAFGGVKLRYYASSAPALGGVVPTVK